MKILITGGAGFIGSAVVRHLIGETAHRVINIDKLTYAGNLDSLAGIIDCKRYQFEQIDICDGDRLRSVFNRYQPQIIMHLAAESHVDRSIDSAGAFIQTNIVGSYQLLEAARHYWERLPAERRTQFKFHHVSTDEVFGDLANDDDLFSEEARYRPSSPYAASKAASDHLVRAWHRTYGLPIVISHCSNNYGPFHFPEKLIPLVITNALEGKPLPIYGDGQQRRDWLYVEDHARALLAVAMHGRIGETYNIGGRNERSNLDVVRDICALMEAFAPKKQLNTGRYSDLITFVDDRPGHDKRYAVDTAKINRELGWQPRESLATGLLKTVKWFLDNESWWRRVLENSSTTGKLAE